MNQHHAIGRGRNGTPSRRSCHLITLLVMALFALVASFASVASAAQVTEHLRSFGPDGTEASDFEYISSVALDEQSGNVYVLDREAGTLYQFDADGTPLPWGGSALYIEGNKITGLDLGFGTRQIAVDSTRHIVYVGEEHSLRAFEQDGEPAEFTSGPGAGLSEIPGFKDLRGVSADVNGSIYTSDWVDGNPSGTLAVYASSGEPLTSLEVAGQPGNVAVAPDGSVFVNNAPGPGVREVNEFVPSQFPVTPTTAYASGKAFTHEVFQEAKGIDVDSASEELYVLEGGGSVWIAKYDSDGQLSGYFGKEQVGSETRGRFPQNSAGIAVVPGGEEFQFYVGANYADASKVELFGEVITPGRPSILATSALDVTSSSATLRARINPNTFATSYRFEYGLSDCEASLCTSVPLGGRLIGSGHQPVSVTQAIAGLQPDTTYHYRVIAENSEDVSVGPERTLTTQVSGLGFELPDERAWEMVSPPDKNGGTLMFLSWNLVQAAEDGSGIAYFSRGSIETDPLGNRPLDPASVLSLRGAAGWSSKDLTPIYSEAAPAVLSSEYRLFNPDLSRSLMEPGDSTPQSPQASERTWYLRDAGEPPTYTPVLTTKEGFANVLPGSTVSIADANYVLMGSNPRLTDLVFRAPAPLVAGATGAGLYRWSGGQVHLLSRLPANEGSESVPGRLGSDHGSVRKAISDDGSRIFWSTGRYESGNDLTALYLRDTLGEESVRLDVIQGGSGVGSDSPVFQGASADGTVVYFTDSRQLTADASPEGRDLYRCEIPVDAAASGCAELTDVSAPPGGSGASAEVQDLAPALSEDGSRIYFVAQGVLDIAPNDEGDSATQGEPNLYLFEEGAGVRFIATFSPSDRPNWGASVGPTAAEGNLIAGASPSGRYLAFMSERSLTGHENADAVSGEPNQQVFRYDAESGELTCASCNPTGGSPNGQQMTGRFNQPFLADRNDTWRGDWVAATLPEPNSRNLAGDTLYRPRAVLDSGRTYFNAVDGIVPADSNGEWDVYQYESVGTGDCTSSSAGPSISRSANGCVSLLSSGSAEGETAFLDASASGDDAFFLTSGRLSVTDVDSELDVYDARVDGVPAKLDPVAECQGESCQPAARAPDDPTPGSGAYHGPGNPQQKVRSPRRCPKGKHKVRRGGGKLRCVVTRKHQAGRRARDGRRAAR